MGKKIYITLFIVFLILFVMSLVGNGLIWTVASNALSRSGSGKTNIVMKVTGIIMAIVYLTLMIVFGVYGFKKEETIEAPANPPAK